MTMTNAKYFRNSFVISRDPGDCNEVHLHHTYVLERSEYVYVSAVKQRHM